MNPLFKMFVGAHVQVYRATGGAIGSSMGGGKVLLLTTTGAKTGLERTVPVMFFEDGGERFVVASFGGAPTHPAWFKNMQKTPDAIVQARSERYRARAEVVTGERRAQLWTKITAQMKQFDDYEKKVAGAREIPVVQLVRTGPA
jgi:deazaflavin-dependent oxidoreductase (nitroreductase family)